MSLLDLFHTIREKITKKNLIFKSKVLSQIETILDRLIFRIQNRHDKRLAKHLHAEKSLSIAHFRYIGLVLSPKEKKIISVLICCAFIAFVVVCFNFYRANTILVAVPGGNFVEGIVGYPKDINPLLTGLNRADQAISSIIFSSLFKYNNNLQLVPDLARDYNLKSDNKTYVIRLKQNIKWHDGEPFTAKDVFFTVNYIQNQTVNLPLYLTLKNVNIALIDDFTIEVTIPEPFTAFIENLTFGILPEHILKDVTPANLSRSEFNQKPVGLGPFKFKSLTKDTKSGVIQSYTLTRNEEYYDKQPYLQTVFFKFYADIDEAFNELKNDSINGLVVSPYLDIAKDIKQGRLLSHNLIMPKYTAIFYNSVNAKVLSDQMVRKSLAMSIDRKKIIDQILNSYGMLISGPVVLQDYLLEDNKDTLYNQKVATDLLVRSGWYKENEIFKRKNKDGSVESLSVVLTTVEHEENMRVATLVKKDWERFGAIVTLKLVPSDSIYQDVIEPRAYEALLYAEQIGSDPNPYPFWHSSQRKSPGLNLSLFNNSQADKLLEESRVENNVSLRQAKYIKFQEIITKEQPATFLYLSAYQYVVNKNINNIKTNKVIDLSGRFANINEWYINTKRVWAINN